MGVVVGYGFTLCLLRWVDVAPARCAIRRVWRVGGATDYYLFFRAQGRMDNHCEWAMISYTAREKDETAPSTVQS